MRILPAAILGLCLCLPGTADAQPARPTVGVAFGGGSARGIAHIGVIQWFEENHIPIDVAAGTSMGGLVGGAFATGMPAAELRTLITRTDWDVMFGSSSFAFKNLRRKEDARTIPRASSSACKRGIVPPTSLNDGQQVDFLLARIAAAVLRDASRSTNLPTPFRAVAVDLRAGEKVVLDSGSFATALRATMSLPGVFPPVERDGRVLVDGGALDNVPADVVRRRMNPSVVIAVDVGLAPDDDVDYSMFGLIGRTVDAMMRASTRDALKSADMTLAVDVDGFRFARLAACRRVDCSRTTRRPRPRRADAAQVPRRATRTGRRGSPGAKAAGSGTFLLPRSWSWTASRAGDAPIVGDALARHLNVPVNTPLLEAGPRLADRTRSVSVHYVADDDHAAGNRTARPCPQPKTYAPPFLMLGLNIENTTSESFRVQLAGRYLAFDVLGAGSELARRGRPRRRSAGSAPRCTSRCAGRRSSPGFAPAATRKTFNFVVNEDTVIAQYREQRQAASTRTSASTCHA